MEALEICLNQSYRGKLLVIALSTDLFCNQCITDKSKNLFYVAITRSKKTVAFLCDGECKLDGVTQWLEHGYET